ncbi:MAG: NADH-quinone oxidoreductase subunit M [Gammaproteobacteria bacterium]
MPALSLIIWVPIAGGIAVLFAGNSRNPASARLLALAVSLLTFLLSLPLYTQFDVTLADMQFVERAPWIESFGVEYYLGVDGFSMPLILLTTFTTVLVVLAGWEVIKDRQAQYLAAFLVQAGFMNGAFAALDAVLFYVFWEALLIPMFLIIGLWGGERRVYATIKFFLFTFLGSVFMLVAILYLYAQADSFSILDMHDVRLGLSAQILIFIGFLLAFAVKVPMWPVHTWLPDAHVEAPTGGSVILAAVMLKLGGYGFLRFSLPTTPDASAELSGLMIALSLVAIVYVGFVALVQPDMKKLIAHSSVSHMGFSTLGFFIGFKILDASDNTASVLGIEGGMAQMISHGFISGALFLCVGVMYDRVHSRRIADYGGVVNTMPVFAALMMLFALANSGLPGTSGFVGEFMVILSSFQADFWIAFLAASTLVLGAGYSLWMYKRVIYGPVANDSVAGLKDLNRREFLILAVLAVAVLMLGLWPAPLLEVMGPSAEKLLEHVSQSKL